MSSISGPFDSVDTDRALAAIDRKRLLVFANELPLPTNHGARIDIWHRYAGLRASGWSLGLVCWRRSHDEMSDELMTKLRKVFDLVEIFSLPNGVAGNMGRALRMLSVPSLAAARYLGDQQFRSLLKTVRDFEPNLIISESIYVAPGAMRIARALDVPFLIRSHNIEHLYMRTQLRLAKSIRSRVSILAALVGLKRFEHEMMLKADSILDISRDDSEFWRSKGVSNVFWVPSVFPELDQKPSVSIPYFERPYDVGYIGNLWAPNNVAALQWFIDSVLPRLVLTKPDVRIFIAGSNPSERLKSMISPLSNVDLIENPVNAAETRALARVLMNPILEGSGLNTKSVEILYCDSPLVVTPFALGGMAPETAEAYVVAPTADAFADAIVSAIKMPFTLSLARRAARDRFGKEGIQALDVMLKERILAFTNGAPKK